MDRTHPDSAVIDRLGGPSALAKRLGIKNRQRAQNWKVRGIPAEVLVDNEWLRRLAVKARASADKRGS